jgi:EAL domain-containing protein (putative c-di-GMP-specific phosphodiesterase class I)
MLHVPGNAGACPVESAVGDAQAHVERAMRALERAMSRGAGSVEVAAEARIERAAADWEMRGLLEEAAQRGELELAYQPIRNLADRRITRLEALVRWVSPHYGRVEPDRFIPMLEESGYIAQAGEWILERACRDLSTWRSKVRAPISVAINVSPLQLRGDFEAHARRIVEDSGCDPRWIELEITEGALIRDFVRVREGLDALVAMGFTLAIDDFGAGYSSLGQLAQLPVHQLKMDRSLLEGVPGSEKKVRIVRAVVALAESLGLAVTAEGIESEVQAQWLGRFAGMQGQGYFFGRPMDAETAFKLLHAADTR